MSKKTTKTSLDKASTEENYPLLSAIMLTGNNTLSDIMLAIDCFKAQTYPNKELIIVNNAKNQSSASKLNINAEDNIFIIDTPFPLTAGMARNYGINAANGQILAQFDADYWHHPTRFTSQVATMANNESHICMLTSCLKYSFNTGVATILSNNKNIVPSTMVLVRPAKVDYPNTDKYEECRFLQRMIQNQYKPITLNSPELSCKLYFNPDERVLQPINWKLSEKQFSTMAEFIPNYKI